MNAHVDTGHPPGEKQRGGGPHADPQLQHDRILAVIAVLVMLALMALVVWLASLGGGAPNELEYGPWMP